MLVDPRGTSRSTVTLPELATTTTNFIYTGMNSNVTRYPDFMMQESFEGIDYTVYNVLDDYLYDLKKVSIHCKLSDEEKNKYRYKPRLLSYDIYKTTELYYIILAINDMWTEKQFTLDSGYVNMLSKNYMSDLLSEIQRNESKTIKLYNSKHTD